MTQIIVFNGYSDFELIEIKLSSFLSRGYVSLSSHTERLVKFICLFVWEISSHSIIFYLYGDVTITDEGL